MEMKMNTLKVLKSFIIIEIATGAPILIIWVFYMFLLDFGWLLPKQVFYDEFFSKGLLFWWSLPGVLYLLRYMKWKADFLRKEPFIEPIIALSIGYFIYGTFVGFFALIAGGLWWQ
jgi:hypothetical protein